jgi:hypothetical protein
MIVYWNGHASSSAPQPMSCTSRRSPCTSQKPGDDANIFRQIVAVIRFGTREQRVRIERLGILRLPQLGERGVRPLLESS